MLTTVSAGVIIAVFYSKKAVTKKVRQLMYTESRGVLRSRQQRLPSDYRFRAGVPNEVELRVDHIRMAALRHRVYRNLKW